MVLTERDNISIAEIAVYTPALIIAVFLAVRHGFNRNAGWLYMVIFSLIRIVGSGVQLGTVSQPKNTSLYIAAAVMQNIGLSPLILVQLGLIGRALVSIRKSTSTLLQPMHLRLVQLLILLGLILGSVGGSQVSTSPSGVTQTSTTSKAGMALNIVGFVLLVLITAAVGFQVSYAEAGEKRLILAVSLSLPFILVRLAYAAAGIYSSDPKFATYSADPSIMLGMAVLMEMIVVAIVEAFGLTLKKLDSADKHSVDTLRQRNGGKSSGPSHRRRRGLIGRAMEMGSTGNNGRNSPDAYYHQAPPQEYGYSVRV